MTTTTPKPARFQLRILDFYVLLALTFVASLICIHLQGANQPHVDLLIYTNLGCLLWWLAALYFRPQKLGEGTARVLRLCLRLMLIFLIPAFVLAIAAAFVLPNLIRPRSAANESAAIGACKTFASAEDTYRRVDYDNNGVLEYARSLKQFHGNGSINLVNRDFVNSERGPCTPKWGYYFRVLTRQGASASGGAQNYIDAAGHMTQGYALIAHPADWGKSGYNTFMISNAGTVYQKNLGSNTPLIVPQITVFDPDSTWISSE